MKITSKIQAIKIPFEIPIAPGKNIERFVYSYFLSGTEQACLIDSGVSGSVPVINDSLKGIGKTVSDISLLILTHSHPDHIGEAQAVRNISKCHVGAYSAAKKWVEDIEKQYSKRPVPGFHSLVGGSVTIDKLLSDNDNIDLGSISLQVIHTPGHSECSISLFCEQEGVIFTGDTIPQGDDLPIYDDVDIAVKSIRRLKNISGIKYLLASWSDPQLNVDPYQIMDKGLHYFQKIHTTIRQLPDKQVIADPMELCRKMVDKLGLPEFAINPLIARSFASHIPLLNQEKL